jgi:N-methylhydantoinase A/acetophenone carboxylase
MKIFQWATQSYSNETEVYNSLVNELKDLAVRDLRLEGFTEEQIQFRLELDMRYGMQYNLTKVVSPHLNVKGPEDFKDICEHFTEQYSAIYSPEATFPRGGINIECFYLTASVEVPGREVAPMELKGAEPPQAARRPSRPAYWAAIGDFTETPVFSFEALEAGNTISGPALIEAKDTTYVLEPGWRFELDVYGNGILERR